MLTDDEVISIKRVKDSYLKLIELVILTLNDTMEIYKVFGDIHRITRYDEKILYLLFVYINNSDEYIMPILSDTDILNNHIVNDFLEKGIDVDYLNSEILKDYLVTHTGFSVSDVLEEINRELNNKKEEIENKKRIIDKTSIDYNLNHLNSVDIKKVENKNNNLKRKVRRKTLYDKYQGKY